MQKLNPYEKVMCLFVFYCPKTEIEIFFRPRIFKAPSTKVFFVGYKFQTLRIESTKPIESPTAFRKNMGKVFPTRHRNQPLFLFLRVS